MGSIVRVNRKTGNVYRAIIRKKGCKPISKTFRLKSSASAWLKRVEGDEEACRARGNVKAAGVTVGDLIDVYKKQFTGKDLGRFALLRYWKKRIGNVKVVDLDSDLIMDVRDELLNERGKRCGKARLRSAQTVNRYQSAISAVFKLALEQRILRANPAVKLPRGKEVDRYGRALDDDERERLLAACKKSSWDRLHLLVTLALTSGARKGELLGLEWRDIDLAKRVATFRDTKNGDTRLTPLVPTVVERLRALPRPLDGTVLLFHRDDDLHQPPVDHWFYRHWREAKETAGIEAFRFHDLRHSACSYLIESGVSLMDTAEQLGHKTLSMVRRYAHLNVESRRAAVEAALADKVV